VINTLTLSQLAFVCAQQRQILNELLLARTDQDPLLFCRRASAYDSAQFVDAKQLLPYEVRKGDRKEIPLSVY